MLDDVRLGAPEAALVDPEQEGGRDDRVGQGGQNDLVPDECLVECLLVGD